MSIEKKPDKWNISGTEFEGRVDEAQEAREDARAAAREKTIEAFHQALKNTKIDAPPTLLPNLNLPRQIDFSDLTYDMSFDAKKNAFYFSPTGKCNANRLYIFIKHTVQSINKTLSSESEDPLVKLDIDTPDDGRTRVHILPAYKQL